MCTLALVRGCRMVGAPPAPVGTTGRYRRYCIAVYHVWHRAGRSRVRVVVASRCRAAGPRPAPILAAHLHLFFGVCIFFASWFSTGCRHLRPSLAPGGGFGIFRVGGGGFQAGRLSPGLAVAQRILSPLLLMLHMLGSVQDPRSCDIL